MCLIFPFIIQIFCVVGHYVYIETSAPARPGFQARLISESLSYATHSCVTFYYHMYGSTIGTLRLWAQLQGTSNPLPLWELSGNQGNSWMKGQVMIPKQQSDFQVCLKFHKCCVLVENYKIEKSNYFLIDYNFFMSTVSNFMLSCPFLLLTCSANTYGKVDFNHF